MSARRNPARPTWTKCGRLMKTAVGSAGSPSGSPGSSAAGAYTPAMAGAAPTRSRADSSRPRGSATGARNRSLSRGMSRPRSSSTRCPPSWMSTLLEPITPTPPQNSMRATGSAARAVPGQRGALGPAIGVGGPRAQHGQQVLGKAGAGGGRTVGPAEAVDVRGARPELDGRLDVVAVVVADREQPPGPGAQVRAEAV